MMYYQFRCQEFPIDFLTGKHGIYRRAWFSQNEKYVVIVKLSDSEDINFATLKFTDFKVVRNQFQNEIEQIITRTILNPNTTIWAQIK